MLNNLLFKTKKHYLHILDMLLISMLLGKLEVRILDRVPSLFWVDITLMILVIFWFIRQSIRRNSKVIIAPGIFKFMVLYGFIILVSLFFAQDILKNIAVAKAHIMPLLVFLLAYNFLRTEEEIQALVVKIVIFQLVLAAMSLFSWQEFYTGKSFLPEEIAQEKNMVQSIVGVSNSVAGVNVLIIPLIIYLILAKKNFFIKSVAIVSLGFSIVSTIFALSRSAMLAFIVGIIVWSITLQANTVSKKILLFILFGSIFFSGIILAWEILPFKETFIARLEISKYRALYDLGSDVRFNMWFITLEELPKILPLGIGIGNFRFVIKPLDPTIVPNSLHNLYLEILVEAGILGFITLLAILLTFGKYLRKLNDLSVNQDQHFFTQSLLMAYAIYIVNVFFEPNYYSIVYSYIFAIMMAMASVLIRIRTFEIMLDRKMVYVKG